MSELISVIIPVYNLGELVNGIAECLLSQSYQNYEAIFVDDGSTDDSLTYLKKIVGANSRCQIIEQANQGAAAARNHGIKAANGKYICFIDGDDKISDDYLEKMLATISKTKSDLAVCNYYSMAYDNHQKLSKHSFLLSMGEYQFPQDRILINNIGNAPWNKLYKTDLIKQNNLVFPEGYRHHDLVFVQRYLLCCQTVSFNDAYLNYYLKDRPNNISTSYDHKINHILKMLELVVKEYQTKGLFDICYLEVQELCLANLILALRKLNMMPISNFTDSFINDSFSFINRYFKNYKHSNFYHSLSKHDKVYLNKIILKLYLKYKKRM